MGSPQSLPVEPAATAPSPQAELPGVQPPEPPAAPVKLSESVGRRRSARRRRRRRVWLLIGVLVVAGGGYAAWRYYFAPTTEATVQYVTSAVTLGNIEDSVSAIGTLSPSQSRTVEIPVSGRIAAINVEIGDIVAEGDVIATLESDGFQATLDAAESQLANLQASLADRQSQLQLQEQNLERQEGLLAANAAAEATVQSARASVVSAQAQLASVQTQIVQQEQTVQNARDNLEAATIYAPIAGTIVSLAGSVGQTVNAGVQLMEISDLSTMTVEAQVSEADISRLSIGMPAYFTTLAGSNRRWTGTLRRILPTPTVENNVVLYSILFDVDNSDGALLIGMSTKSFFVVVGADNVLRVPIAALHAIRGGAAAAAAAAVAPATANATAAPPAPADATTQIAQRFGQAPAANPAPTEAAPAVAAPATDAGAAAAAEAPAGGAQLPAGVDPTQLQQAFQNGQLPAGVDREQLRQAFANGGLGNGQLAQGFQARQSTAVTQTGPTNYTAEVMNDDGTIETRTVLVGVQDRVNAEVLDGLTAGERVVVSTTTGAAATAPAPGAGGGAGVGLALPGGGGAGFFLGGR